MCWTKCHHRRATFPFLHIEMVKDHMLRSWQRRRNFHVWCRHIEQCHLKVWRNQWRFLCKILSSQLQVVVARLWRLRRLKTRYAFKVIWNIFLHNISTRWLLRSVLSSNNSYFLLHARQIVFVYHNLSDLCSNHRSWKLPIKISPEEGIRFQY